MKKIIVLLIAILLITGCNDTNKKRSKDELSLLDEVVLDEKDAKYVCSFYNTDNKEYNVAGKYAIFLDEKENVIMVSSEEIIESKNYDLLNQFESYYNSNYEKITNYGGYTYDIHQENNRLIADVIVDYNTLNIESYIEEYPDVAPYVNEEFKITKDKIIEMYNSQNIRCEKK